MKQKIILLLVSILCHNFFLCNEISAQYLDPVMNPHWEYYSTNILSSVSAGKGNTGVASTGDVSLIYLNPATLNISNKFQLNANYNLKSKSISLTQNFYSFSIAGAFRLNNNFQLGLAYQNDYSFDYTPGIVTNWSYTNTFETHSFRIPLVYNYRWLRIGTNLNLIYFKSSSYGCLTENLWKLNPEIGMIITPIQEFSFGASLIHGFTGNPDIVNNCLGNETYTTIVKFPNRIKAGTEVRLLNNNLKLTMDYHYANSGNIENLKDQSNYHIGLEYSGDGNLILRCGFFTMFDFENNAYYSSYNDDLYFITIGTTYKLNNYSFNLGAISNFSGSSGSREYQAINFGAGYEF